MPQITISIHNFKVSKMLDLKSHKQELTAFLHIRNKCIGWPESSFGSSYDGKENWTNFLTNPIKIMYIIFNG